MKRNILVILVFLATSPIYAQALSLSEAINQVTHNHPDLKQFREKLEEAEITKSRAYSELFPTIHATLSALRKDDANNTITTANATLPFNGNSYNYYTGKVEATQPLFRWGFFRGGIGKTESDIAARQYELEFQERDYIKKTIKAYYDVILAQLKLDSVQRNEEIQKELLQTAERRYRVGNEQQISVLQQRTSLLSLAPQVSQAKSQLRISGDEMAALLSNAQAIKEIKIKGTLRAPVWDDILRKVPKESKLTPEVLQTQKEIESLEDEKISQVSLDHLPQLNLTGSWGRTGYEKSDLFDQDATAWQVGIELKIPLFSGLSSFYDRSIYSSKIAQLRFKELSQRQTLALESDKANQNLEYKKNNVAETEKVYEQAGQALKVARNGYKLGTTTYLQVSDTQKQESDSDFAYRQAQYDYLLEMVNFFNLKNWPLEILVAELERNNR